MITFDSCATNRGSMVNGVQYLLVSIYDLFYGPSNHIHIDVLCIPSVWHHVSQTMILNLLRTFDEIECGRLNLRLTSDSFPYPANNWPTTQTRHSAVAIQGPATCLGCLLRHSCIRRYRFSKVTFCRMTPASADVRKPLLVHFLVMICLSTLTSYNNIKIDLN